MLALLVPTRQELLHALWFPALMAPFLLVFVRYRMLTWDVSFANRRDRVDYSPEAWRLSGYITTLFVFVAYPVTIAEYDAWLWSAHARLTIATIVFWISAAGWLVVRHFQLQSIADEKLLKDLKAISSRSPASPLTASPAWLQAWGWANAILFAMLLAGFMRLVRSLQ